MKLLDLSPRLISRSGEIVALVFKCPCCPAKSVYISVGFVTLAAHEQDALYIDEMEEKERKIVLGFREGAVWKVRGADYALDRITILPSVDAGAAGHWHGHITNGMIV